MSNKKYIDELIVKAESYNIVDVGARDLIDKQDIEINAIKDRLPSNEAVCANIQYISLSAFNNLSNKNINTIYIITD